MPSNYLHYNHVTTRDRSPYCADPDPFYSQPLVRRYSKRQRVKFDDEDDEFDDYPKSYPVKAHRPSRALTIRQPTQLEKYNVFNNVDEREPEYRQSHRSSNVQKLFVDRSYESDDDRDEREFRLKVKATLGRPKSSHSQAPMSWASSVFKRKDKWERVDWESRETRGGDGFWDDEPTTKEYRYRTLKRTKTDEWKPLTGFRRF